MFLSLYKYSHNAQTRNVLGIYSKSKWNRGGGVTAKTAPKKDESNFSTLCNLLKFLACCLTTIIISIILRKKIFTHL